MDDLYLGIGSNMGDRGENIKAALVLLERWGIKVLRSSSIYETEPVGFKDQDWYYNIAVKAQTGLDAADVLKATVAIENALKRERQMKWGPRTMDIDLLLYGDLVMDKPDLRIPHPFLHERRFVLCPLAEIAPDFVHPELKKTVRELLNECVDASIVSHLK
ncbi:2-amino-4-hydroxy-6-hydroxymethyldihydropteridine diphosphokinase [Patescibacteria group bacterium]|nr:2-amino-4-hydroxy-6-hydroxymethyldihydropteridine diphosphokinase [Patescibacteria group bacterium]MBU1703388.1 2-amino-4-hydroxy-6-hydroxymethyldihydropteridine diphosphokinase [Patescibacteria group bacterium]MBU1953902.1 2-amino-4-hydroxy-6-hydroxymethyldihydropteridine diphosphokinase [Patescibacteria group bacterium]